MKLRNLDILRACLALMVLIGHARMLLWMPWHEWRLLPHGAVDWMLGLACCVFRYGGEAVAVFFALSGYFIHLRIAIQAARRVPVEFSVGDYLGRRVRRILPPYYVVLLLTVLLDAFGGHFWPELYAAQTGDHMLDENFAAHSYSTASVVPALLGQPKLLGLHFGSNGPLWSIGNEVFYYALYPLFVMFWLRSRALAYGIGFGAGLLAWQFGIGSWWSPMLASYPMWLGGALLAEWSTSKPALVMTRMWFWVSLLVAMSAFGLSHLKGAFDMPVLVLMGAGTVAAVEALPFDALRWRVGRWLEWIGVRSYSIYIVHFPVQVVLAAWCFHSLGARPSSGWLAVAGTCLSLIAGLFVFRLVESRFLPRRLAVAQPA